MKSKSDKTNIETVREILSSGNDSGPEGERKCGRVSVKS